MSIFDPIRLAYGKIVPDKLRPDTLWYWFKCWVWHRYSTVKPRNLSHTWIDRCDLMPHVMFELLSEFIEKECDKDCHIEWYGDSPYMMIDVGGKEVNVRDEMQDLYDWWHTDYLVNTDTTHDEWSAHQELYCKNTFSSMIEDNLSDHSSNFDSVEIRSENYRLFKEAGIKEEHYEKELKSRLHRIVNIAPYMWT